MNGKIVIKVNENPVDRELVYRLHVPIQVFEEVDLDALTTFDEQNPTIPQRLRFLADLIEKYEDMKNGQS